MKSSRKADCSVRINAASPLHDRCEQIKTNGSNQENGLDFVNPSTDPATYETGIAGVVQGPGSMANHVTLPAHNPDVKNALTPFTSIFNVTFTSILHPSKKITRIREPCVTEFAHKSGIAV
jgi:hypothetical protein